jgi:oxygen-independent coproporphyrinogen-3 oxidase
MAGRRTTRPAGTGRAGLRLATRPVSGYRRGRVEIGVYIHFPFCRSRCGYCEFYSTASDGDLPHRAYADAVLAELERRAPEHAGSEPSLGSVYVGGGTPSLWKPAELARVLDGVRRAFPAHDRGDPEVTVEANPGAGMTDGLEQLRAAGVNRLSIGVQSLDDRVLALLGRSHTAAQARRAVARARATGFPSVGCDLMAGTPDQPLAHHLEQLERLLELEPDHVSVYSLTLTPHSPLGRAGLAPAASDLAAEMLEQGRARLEAAGLPQYEVSNYAAAPFRSVHNRGVWAGRPYLGLGAGAHSMRWEGPVNLRTVNPPVSQYLAGRGGQTERVEEPLSRFEVVMLGLRTVDGVDREAYRRRFGADLLQHYAEKLPQLASWGLIAVEPRAVRPTARGIWFADEIAVRLLG